MPYKGTIYLGGWLCEKCKTENDMNRVSCSNCGEPRSSFPSDRVLPTHPIASWEGTRDWGMTVVGSTRLMSETMGRIEKNYSELQRQIGELEKEIGDSKKSEGRIKELEGSVSNLQGQNTYLKRLTNNLIAGFISQSKKSVELHIAPTQVQTQQQVQQQIQSQTLDIHLYRDLMKVTRAVEKDISQNKKEYEFLGKKRLNDLKKLISEVKRTEREGLWLNTKNKIVSSEIYKFLAKPENIVKVSNVLTAFLSLIDKIPS